jgi:uncharacterized membrane protein (UPF0136 family)
MIYFALIYGILTIVGGIIGYMKAGSNVSLISGIVSGILILGSAWAFMKGNVMGYYGLVALSGILAFVFVMRLMKTHAFMPSGMMLALSAIVLVGLLIKRPELLASLK